MTGFEPRTSSVWGNHSSNWDTTTAQHDNLGTYNWFRISWLCHMKGWNLPKKQNEIFIWRMYFELVKILSLKACSDLRNLLHKTQ